MKTNVCILLLSAAALGGACSSVRAADPARLAGKILVLAATSTSDAVDEIRVEFTRRHPAVTVRASFAASSALAQQIAAGAGADLFLSASSQWADFLAKRKLVARRRDLLGNRLVVILPVDSKLKIGDAQDLAQSGVRRLALADPQAVPAGIYARGALEKLQLWKKLERRVAGAADVRQALKFVETGAADAGIVYSTDAAGNPNVRVVLALAPELSEPIRYPLLLLKQAEPSAAAVAFYEFLASPAAAAVFERYGFVVLAKTGKPAP
jgi:molybdate transport system substrate-binding protein